ncbi:DciA family protein [Streptomyces sp. NPDC096339]|uniref:DciA family protein n=1 Tax=Streptomyces sp. NPDC096339 TaxID=3366086 RepID=UPI00381A43A7
MPAARLGIFSRAAAVQRPGRQTCSGVSSGGGTVVEHAGHGVGRGEDDMARIALREAIRAARRKPAEAAVRRRRPRRAPEGSRPVSLAVALLETAERYGWPANKEANLLRQWPALVGEVSANLIAVSFDPASSTLHLRATSRAWTTQGRLLASGLAERVNEALGGQTVRAIAILPPGPAPLSGAAPPLSLTPVPPAFAAQAQPQRDRQLFAAAQRQTAQAPRGTDPLGAENKDQQAAHQQSAEAVRTRAIARAHAE